MLTFFPFHVDSRPQKPHASIDLVESFLISQVTTGDKMESEFGLLFSLIPTSLSISRDPPWPSQSRETPGQLDAQSRPMLPPSWIMNNNINNNREFIERFSKLKALYNLKEKHSTLRYSYILQHQHVRDTMVSAQVLICPRFLLKRCPNPS